MTALTKFEVGQIVFQGHGLLNGRDVDDSGTSFYAAREEAQEAIESEWLAWLSDREKANADSYVRGYTVDSLDDDGSPGCCTSI